jgi:hypothetical protein
MDRVAKSARFSTIAAHSPHLFSNSHRETPIIEIETHKAFVDKMGGSSFSGFNRGDEPVANCNGYNGAFSTGSSLSDINEKGELAIGHPVSAGYHHSPVHAVHESYSSLNGGHIDTSSDAPFTETSFGESYNDSLENHYSAEFFSFVAEELSSFLAAPATPPRGETEQPSAGFPVFGVTPLTPPQEISCGAVAGGFEEYDGRYNHLVDMSNAISDTGSTPEVLMPRPNTATSSFSVHPVGAKRSFAQYDETAAKSFKFEKIFVSSYC